MMAVLLALPATAGAAGTAGAATGATGAVLYVAPGGSDGAAGTREDPFGTITHAVTRLGPGDTLKVRGGTYRERVGLKAALTPGTPDARVTVRAEDGERPVVVGGFDTGNVGMPDYWTFDGINLAWDGALGSNAALARITDGVGWEWRNSEIWGNRSYAAVRIMTERSGQPDRWVFAGNCVHDTLPPAGSPLNHDHNLYISTDGGTGLVERNVIYGAPNGANIKLGAGSPDLAGTSGVTVRRNTMAGALHNVLVPWRSHDNRIEWNLLERGAVPAGKQWYPNIRGLQLTGTGNVAAHNAGHGSGAVLHHGTDSRALIADAGGNRLLQPGFAGSSCGGLRNPDGAAAAYGAASVLERVAGAGRVETSVALARAAFPSPEAVDAVLLARSDAYPDALSGAPLAASVGGPILLTTSGGLHAAAAAEVRRLRPSTAYLLGGPAALDEQVARDLRAAGVAEVERIGGNDRFETAALVAARVGGAHAYVVEGANADPRRGWPDAVAVAPLAALERRPILLVTRDKLPDATRRALVDLGVTDATVVGGEAAVSGDVADAVGDPAASGSPTVDVERIAGPSRYDTAAAVAARAAAAGADATDVWFATGTNYPDALAAGPAVASARGVLLLVDGGLLDASPAARRWLEERSSEVTRITLVGGPGAISLPVQDGLAAAADA